MAEHMAFIGRCPGCNHLVFAAVDNPDYKKDTAESVAKAIRDGLIVDRVSCDIVRKELHECTCGNIRLIYGNDRR